MNDLIVRKLKKYVFFISAFFFVILGTHISYLYMYQGAQSEAIKGGSISEAIIGTFPNFNPLIPSSDHNAYINRLLYRSILEYSTTSQSLESDLMECNLENLVSIECSLNTNALWSDGTPITIADIVGTFHVIEETKVNPILASLLEDTKIVEGENSLRFTRSAKDINILYLFLQPILPASITENLNSENAGQKFSEVGAKYSGRFKLTSINQDDTIGVTKFTLQKNENFFENPLYFDFLILHLFQDEEHFLKNKNNFNVFNDKNNIIGESIPRLQNHSYTLPQFTNLFFNTEKISLPLRKYLSSTISRDEIISQIGKNSIAPAYNPFLTERKIDTTGTEYNLEESLKSQGFSKKEILKYSLSQEKVPEEKIVSQEVALDTRPIQEKLSYVYEPDALKYHFISEDNVLVSGNVPDGVEAVYINDYKLNGFSKGNSVFHYRLLESYDTISPGENRYKVVYEKNGEKKLMEEFVYLYEKDATKLASLQANYFRAETQVAQNSGSTLEEKKKETSSHSGFTLQNAENLEEGFYYNKNGEAFSLSLVYPLGDEKHQASAELIAKKLESLGIKIELKALGLSDITSGLRNESLSYDIMLLGINLGFLESDIFPYFHSSQAGNGYNISNFKKLSLDILLEELKANNLTKTKQDELIGKMLDILEQEVLGVTLYTPKINLLVDKNIKKFSIPSFLPDSVYRYYPFIGSYLSEKRTINFQEKSFLGFWKYNFKTLFGIDSSSHE